MAARALSVVAAALTANMAFASTSSRRRAPSPPPPPPTPTPPLPPPNKTACQFTPKCQQGLAVHRPCLQTTRNSGHQCYEALKVWQKDLTQTYGCPDFSNPNKSIVDSQAFCWCGLAAAAPDFFNVSTDNWVPIENTDLPSMLSQPLGGACHNKKDGPALKHRGKNRMSQIMKDCGNKEAALRNPPQGANKKAYLTNCIRAEVHPPGAKYAISPGCASCFAGSVECSEANCIAECACVSWQNPQCNNCMKQKCQASFDQCSGLKSADATIDEDDSFAGAFSLYATNSHDAIDSGNELVLV